MSWNNTSYTNIKSLNYNQDFSCIAVGTNLNYKIFNCDPFGECFSKDDDGGANLIEMLFSTSLIAVVGTGDKPSNSPRRLKIINTKRRSTICELNFPTSILNVKLNRKRLVVVLLEQIYIYDISCMKFLHTIETTKNYQGLVALSITDESILAYPAPSSNFSNYRTHDSGNINGTNNSHGGPSGSSGANGGSDGVHSHGNGNGNKSGSHGNGNYDSGHNYSINSPLTDVGSNDSNLTLDSTGSISAKHQNNHRGENTSNGSIVIFDALNLQPIEAIVAHKSDLAAISLNSDGSLIATASTKGTIIRVFTTKNGKKVGEFRRGMAGTMIHSLNFNLDSTLLCSSSNNSTIHIFKLDSSNPDAPVLSAQSSNSTSTGSAPPSTGSTTDTDDLELRLTENAQNINEEVENATNNVLLTKKRSTSLSGMLWNKSKKLSHSIINNYLPQQITSILEPQRHFAFIKLPRSSGEEELDSPESKCVVALSHNSNYIMIATSEGSFYIYNVPLEKGGECALIKQYFLLDE